MIKFIVKIAIATGLLWFLVHTSKINFSLLPDLLHSPFLLSITITLFAVITLINSWRWYILNKAQNIALPFSRALALSYIGMAFNNLLPSSVGGDALRFYYVTKQTKASKSKIMSVILFDRITGLMGLLLIAGIVAVLYLPSINQQHILYKIISLFALGCTAGCLAFFAFMFWPQRFANASKWLQHPRYQSKWLKPIITFLTTMLAFRQYKWIVLQCVLFSLPIQLMIMTICLLIAQMLAFPALPTSQYVLATAITQLVNLIPITPGGFGVGEMAFANILTGFNPHLSLSYATIFIAYRILGIVLYLPAIPVVFTRWEALSKCPTTDTTPSST